MIYAGSVNILPGPGHALNTSTSSKNRRPCHPGMLINPQTVYSHFPPRAPLKARPILRVTNLHTPRVARPQQWKIHNQTIHLTPTTSAKTNRFFTLTSTSSQRPSLLINRMAKTNQCSSTIPSGTKLLISPHRHHQPMMHKTNRPTYIIQAQQTIAFHLGNG